MFGGDRFEDLIGQISIGKCEPPLGGVDLLPPPPSSSIHLQTEQCSHDDRLTLQEKT
jgi:hypothetical protein